MRSLRIFLVISLFAFLLFSGCSDDETTTAKTGWQLVWSDEFNNAAIDTTKWNYNTGDFGWGNNELQNYTSSTANAFITNIGTNSMLAIKVVYGGGGYDTKDYTSARLHTQGKASWTYGKIEARIKLPYGNGIWPAFWMLGENFTNANGGGGTVAWPVCGEIDILETGEAFLHDKLGGAIHYDKEGWRDYRNGRTIMSSGIFADDYHVYSIEWDVSKIVWKLDGNQFYEIDISTAEFGAFHKPFHLLLNVAVGSSETLFTGGSPDGTTVFPQHMLVDWVRVYQLGEGQSTIFTASSSSTTYTTVTPTSNVVILYSDDAGEALDKDICVWPFDGSSVTLGGETGLSADSGNNYMSVTTNYGADKYYHNWWGWGIHAKNAQLIDLTGYAGLVYHVYFPSSGGYNDNFGMSIQSKDAEYKWTNTSYATKDTWISNYIDLASTGLNLSEMRLLFSIFSLPKSDFSGSIYVDHIYYTK